jgi:hypothetical protein
MALTRFLDRWRDRRPRELYQRYGARPWDLLDEGTRRHYRQLVADGIDGAGQPLPRRPFRSRRRPDLPVSGYCRRARLADELPAARKNLIISADASGPVGSV